MHTLKTAWLALLLRNISLCFHPRRPLSYRRCRVSNITDPQIITARGDGRRQDSTVPALARFHARVTSGVLAHDHTIHRIVRICHWTRLQQDRDDRVWRFDRSADSGDIDPELLLKQQHGRKPGACRRFGCVLAGALLSTGIPARLVSLQPDFTDQGGHVMVEAWVEELQQWVLVDPTADTLFVVDGQYASLVEFRRALLTRRFEAIRFERSGSTLDPAPQLNSYAEIARHAFVVTDEALFTEPPLTKASLWSFSVLHLVDEHAEPYPTYARTLIAISCGLGIVSGIVTTALLLLAGITTVVRSGN